MARRRFEPKDTDKIFDQLETETPRAVITVAGSLIEYALEFMISTRLREPETNKENEVLFSDFGIIGTLSQKIWMAYFMSLIGKNTRHDLDIIRVIRNICAHDMNPVSFEQREIAQRINSLKFLSHWDKEIPTERIIFTQTSHCLAAAMLVRAAGNSHSALRDLKFVKMLDD